NHLVYDAFGNVTRMGSRRREPAVDALFLFTARPFDQDSRLQYNLNRWYDPAVGRWLSEDPVGFTAGDANLYRYVGNRAISLHDPSGTAKREVTCTFDNGREVWSVTIAATTQETAAEACQRYARGWGWGTPWRVITALEGAIPGQHSEHGGTWESDYADLRVRCEACQRDRLAEEKRCRDAVALRAAGFGLGRNVTSWGEAILGHVGTAAGVKLVLAGQIPGVGWTLIAAGVVLSGKGYYDVYVTAQIGTAAQAAANRYCNCNAVVVGVF
ncbi:MAG: RHS repeat-associated core domain-containing protein, partial [Verrucomicrobia bacterium]|nr:RHS repeat-associated core domain-containing protein [Verrucomicrobiota bacterium]